MACGTRPTTPKPLCPASAHSRTCWGLPSGSWSPRFWLEHIERACRERLRIDASRRAKIERADPSHEDWPVAMYAWNGLCTDTNGHQPTTTERALNVAGLAHASRLTAHR